jgi:hypothetical protein
MKTLFLTILLITELAFCDQAVVIPKIPADRAATLLKGAKSVIHYCAPCDDDKTLRESVKSVSVKVWDGGKTRNQFTVSLNGNKIDLAYIYIEKGGSWMNLARLVNFEVIDVPTVLDTPPEKTEVFKF